MSKKTKYTKTKYPNIYLYETKKGKMYCVRRSFMLHGKRKEVNESGYKTIPEARAALAVIELKIDNGEYSNNKQLTVDDQWERYYKKKTSTKQWKPDTEFNKIYLYNKHFKPRYGHVKIRDIDRDEYEDYINSLLKTYSKKTVRQLHGIFMAIINDAVYNGNILQNTLQKIYIGESDIEPIDKSVEVADFKTWDDKAKEILDDYDYLMVRLEYYSLRMSETLGIKLKTHSILPNGQVQLDLRSSRTQRREDIDKDEMKTNDSKRYVILDLETSRLYLKIVDMSHKIANHYDRILGPNDYLFVAGYKGAHRKGHRVPASRIPELYKKVSKACGIHITPHMMRHFFTTQGLIHGVSMEHMAAVLGHSTSYMTERYGHIKNEVSAHVTDTFISAIK